jgi:nucleoside phosphorylase
VFGCDVTDSGSSSRAGFGADAEHPAQDAYVAVDMESAAVARAAAAAGLPFIAFRAVSDGEGDPLGLPGFPAQFFAYYPLAANNAAAAATAFLERLAGQRGSCG